MAANISAVRRFTVDEYYRMAEAGILHEDDRVELIEGSIVQMSPIGARHASCVERLNRALARALDDNSGWLRIQDPLRLADDSELQPDIVIAKPPALSYADRHPVPDDVLLLIEVADSSLIYDRQTKVPLYAAAGIPEVWVFDLTQDRVEVYTEPGRLGYASRVVANRGDTIAPTAFPALRIALSEIIP